MSDESSRPHRAAFDPNEPAITIRRPGGPAIVLSLHEYRLALIGLADFGGDWETMLAATAFVLDGDKKGALIRDRLLPIAEHLSLLSGRAMDGLELLAARHWFRNGEV